MNKVDRADSVIKIATIYNNFDIQFKFRIQPYKENCNQIFNERVLDQC